MAVADFHGVPDADENLRKFLEHSYDCLILMGDITNMGPLSVAEDILAKAKATGMPVLAVPGNCDPKPILELLDKYGVNLHAKSVKLGDLTFVGLGGSNLTPFNTPFELTEAEIKEELERLSSGVDKNWVLVTHAPPHETKVDKIEVGAHVGSKSIRQIIESRQPLVALCAHVHEARNTDELGRTLIINPGQISKGYAAEVTINASGASARLLEL